MTKFLLLATLFFFINAPASQAQTPDAYAEQTFKGKIDNQYEIELALNKFTHTKSAKVSFSLPENANNWDLVNSYVENDAFVIGANNSNATKWQWDGQRFNEAK